MHSAKQLLGRLRLPVICAPMFLVSGVDLVAAACRAGIVGAFPAANARTPERFGEWLDELDRRLAPDGGTPAAPYAVNLVVARGRGMEGFVDVCRSRRAPLVITSVGNPSEMVKEVHGWGGLVFHDVTTIRHAEKAATAGVDGLILVCAGAGGHSGALSPFAFLPQVRRFFDGMIVLAGGITDGRSISAAQTLGADLVYMGTRFIASRESMASDAYKDMVVTEPTANILYTNAISGLPANFMTSSIQAAGLDVGNLPPPKGLHRPDLPEGVKAWKDVWSAGQGAGLIDDCELVSAIVDRLAAEWAASSEAVGGFGYGVA